MNSNTVLQAIQDIKTLKTQGASQVKKSFLKNIKIWIEQNHNKNLNQFNSDFQHIVSLFVKARSTEPAVFNMARKLLELTENEKSLSKLKQELIQLLTEFENRDQQNIQKIIQFGQKVVPNKSIAFTHCHSHTVEAILIQAKNKIDQVIATETRPLFQGRITAKNLAQKGIHCTLIVDNAAQTFMPKADFLITGADSVLANGNLINKIGTSIISKIAQENKVPHYVACTTEKMDPLSFFGKDTEIEQRNTNEVWSEQYAHITVLNPAFDITPARQIQGYITEKGILKPKKFAQTMKKEFKISKQSKQIFEKLFK
ncbi:MAG: S-methyl-5-thioribose-1-phosphate isomerase [Candidatus Diapherotrites archaeon]|nr:S-methyl-5-thioribose-1-phosphate isomerase [Candidatus Diapherotrites archaeon]